MTQTVETISNRQTDDLIKANTQLSTENEELKQEKAAHENLIQELKAKITGLEQEVKHKTEMTEQLKTVIACNKRNKTKLTSRLRKD